MLTYYIKDTGVECKNQQATLWEEITSEGTVSSHTGYTTKTCHNNFIKNLTVT